jgi:hypothetical protein
MIRCSTPLRSRKHQAQLRGHRWLNTRKRDIKFILRKAQILHSETERASIRRTKSRNAPNDVVINASAVPLSTDLSPPVHHLLTGHTSQNLLLPEGCNAFAQRPGRRSIQTLVRLSRCRIQTVGPGHSRGSAPPASVQTRDLCMRLSSVTMRHAALHSGPTGYCTCQP